MLPLSADHHTINQSYPPQQHQQKRLCCGLPTLQWLSSHPTVFKPQRKICTLQQGNGTGILWLFVPPVLHRNSPAQGQCPQPALSRTAPANTSSCLRHQLSKISQEKIHPGAADPVPPPGHVCPQVMCIGM